MRKILSRLLMFSLVLTAFFMPSSKVYADELNCIVTVNVNDVLGEYNDNIVIYLQTANEEQKKEYSNGIYGEKSFLTQDFGNASLRVEMGNAEWKLVDSTLSEPQPFEVKMGTTVSMDLFLIPSESNEKYAEYSELISVGTEVTSNVLNQLGVNSTSTSVADYGNGENFDFEGWHSEAMQAYETYISLLESKTDDSTWKNVFDYAEITRASVKKVYADSVKGATEEEWNGLSKTDVIDYFTTYLNFVLVKDRSNDYYDSHFKNGETAKQNYFRDSVGVGMWTGNGSEELLSAYMTVAEYQLQYFEYYSFPYNFHNDKSYAEEIGIAISEEETEEVISKDDFTDEEIEEIEEVAEELGIKEQSKGIWGEVLDKLKDSWLTIVILAGAIVALLVVRKKIKDKNIDDMSESGK